MKIWTMTKTMLGMAPNCEKVNSFLVDYVDGTLPEKTAKQFEEHIGMCKCCGSYFEQYRTTIEMTKCDPCAEMPKELVEHTLSFLRKNTDFSK